MIGWTQVCLDPHPPSGNIVYEVRTKTKKAGGDIGAKKGKKAGAGLRVWGGWMSDLS